MSELAALYSRFRLIRRFGVGVALLTLVCWAALPQQRSIWDGLLIGEAGGAYVVYSMMRQGHLKDSLDGRALFASGMAGAATRMIVLAAVMVVAVKTPGVNPLAALTGYLAGFAVIFVGLFGYVRGHRLSSGGR